MKFLGILLVSALADHQHATGNDGSTSRQQKQQIRREHRIILKNGNTNNWDVNQNIGEVNEQDRLNYSNDPSFGQKPPTRAPTQAPMMDWNHSAQHAARQKLLNSMQNPTNLEYEQVIPKSTKMKYVKNAIIMLHNFEKAAFNRGEVPVGTERIFNATLIAIEKLMRETEAIPNFIKEAIERKKEAAFRGEHCDPGTGCGAVFDFSKIWNYGCWCYFGENAGKGMGPPQNVIDKNCKDLQLCYRCVKIDSLGDKEICKPGQTSYEYHAENVEGGFKVTCKLSNPDNKCAYHTCCCEQDFISKMIELLWNGYLFDYSYHHSVWSTRWNTCSYSGGPHTLDCCGEYPNRRPYFTDTHLDCCNNRVLYNFNHKMCCKDGMVRDQC